MPEARSIALVALGLLFSIGTERPALRPAPAAPEPAREAEPTGFNVVLVTVDGVRWQEIFDGADPALADGALLPGGEARAAGALTPNLHRLFFEEGTVLGDPRRGEGLRAGGPVFVSLPAYVEIMTGAPSGCDGNDCEPRVPWSIAAAVARRPGGGAAVFASWERITRTQPAAATGLLLSAGRAPGEQAPAYPGNGDYRPDRRTAEAAIEHLVHHRPRFLWVSLGDTDEWAHRHDYRGYLEALRFADGFVGEIAAHLDEMGDYGARTAILVTTDHGRDAGFADHGGAASANVWLMGRGGPIPRRGSTATARAAHLADVAPTIAAILGEPSRRCATCGEVLAELR
jgi:Metalloenzyme superfamily